VEPKNQVSRGGSDPPVEIGNFAGYLLAYCEYREFQACAQYSQHHLLGGGSDAAFCHRHCSNMLS